MSDFVGLLTRLSEAAVQWQNLLGSICFVLGMWLVFTAIRRANEVSERGGGHGGLSWGGVSGRFLAGILLVSLPTMMGSMTLTLFKMTDSDVNSIFNESQTTAALFTDGDAKIALVAALTFIRVVGATGVARGIYKLNKAAEEPGREHFGSGLTHIIAGICAWNAGVFAGYIDRLLFGG